jgi:hypothetical protein
MRSAHVLALFLATACGSNDAPPATGPSNTSTASGSATGHASIENAVRAFNSALEAGDAITIRAQFPQRAAFASHVEAACADGWQKMFDQWPPELLKIGDVQAVKGTQSRFVTVETTDTKSIAAGVVAEGCKLIKPLTFVKTASTWTLEGESHKFALTLVQIDGRFFAFDVPSL